MQVYNGMHSVTDPGCAVQHTLTMIEVRTVGAGSAGSSALLFTQGCCIIIRGWVMMSASMLRDWHWCQHTSSPACCPAGRWQAQKCIGCILGLCRSLVSTSGASTCRALDCKACKWQQCAQYRTIVATSNRNKAMLAVSGLHRA